MRCTKFFVHMYMWEHFKRPSATGGRRRFATKEGASPLPSACVLTAPSKDTYIYAVLGLGSQGCTNLEKPSSEAICLALLLLSGATLRQTPLPKPRRKKKGLGSVFLRSFPGNGENGGSSNFSCPAGLRQRLKYRALISACEHVRGDILPLELWVLGTKAKLGLKHVAFFVFLPAKADFRSCSKT